MTGIELRKLRKKLGYNQEELATLLEVSANTIINWEKKERLSSKAERLIKDYLNSKRIDITGDFNQVGDNNKNFLSEPKLSRKIDKREAELIEENKRLTQELLDCKNQLIEILTKNK